MLVEMFTALTPWNNKINNDSSQFSMMFVVSAPIILFIYFVCLFIYLLACEFICVSCYYINILTLCSSPIGLISFGD